MNDIGAIGTRITTEEIRPNSTIQTDSASEEISFNSRAEESSATDLQDGIDMLNNSGIADILAGEEIEQESNEDRLNALRESVLNEDGTLNPDNVIDFFKSDSFSFEDLAQALEGETDENYFKSTHFTELERAIFLNTGECIIEDILRKEEDNDEDNLYVGKKISYSEFYNFDSEYDPELYTSEILNSQDCLLLVSAETYTNRSVDIKHEKKPMSNEFTSQCFNENGINPENVSKLIESGEMDVGQFLNAAGYDLRDEDDQNAIRLTRSNTFDFTLPDGTKAEGLISDWSGTLGQPYVHLTTPDGKEYRFEYESKK